MWGNWDTVWTLKINVSLAITRRTPAGSFVAPKGYELVSPD